MAETPLKEEQSNKSLKGVPGLPKWVSGSPKLSKSMILTSQNLEHPLAKLLNNGTVAGYARSALDNFNCISNSIF